MADVRPFRALRYRPGTDLAKAICPPFDVISPEQQRELYERSFVNSVRIELADESQGDRYQSAAATLAEWRESGLLRQDPEESFYLYRQSFQHGVRYTRTILFAQLRLEPWEAGVVLPHEQTFGAPKEDRLKLMRAIRMNTSPVYMLYRDKAGAVRQQIERLIERQAEINFSTADGQQHALRRVYEKPVVEALKAALANEILLVADGHHRYETALAYRDEVRAATGSWTGEEPENFVMVALTAADDPGLVVLPIHRVTSASVSGDEAFERIDGLFTVTSGPLSPSQSDPTAGERESGLNGADVHRTLEIMQPGSMALVSHSRPFNLNVLTPKDKESIEQLMPQDRSPKWRALDYSVANHVVLQHCLMLTVEDMSNYDRLWFTEDAEEAVQEVRAGKARYAVLIRPVPVEQVLALAEAGERMPQKSTFFYPKVPTGLVFNLLEG